MYLQYRHNDFHEALPQQDSSAAKKPAGPDSILFAATSKGTSQPKRSVGAPTWSQYVTRKQVDSMVTQVARSNCAAFTSYTDATLEDFLAEVSNIQSKRANLRAALKNLTQSVDTLIATIPGSDTDFLLGTVTPTQARDVVVNLTVTPHIIASLPDNSVSVTMGDPIRTSFVVTSGHTVVPEFAMGVIATNIAYARFGTGTNASGQTIVARSADDRQNSAAIAVLNIVPSWTDGLLIGQIGVGSSKDYPLLLAGAGIRMTTPVNWSLTFGAVFTWQQQLTKLSINDPVDGTAAVQSDLSYRLIPRPAFYVGLLYGF